MMYVLYPPVLFLGLPLLVAAAYWRWYYYKEPVYEFSSLLPFKKLIDLGRWHKIIPFILRCSSLLFLCLALARVRVPDSRSKIPVQGIDIMLVLDVSGSMMAIDDRAENRTRLSIAKDEAISFIQKRQSDPIGLVLFSEHAVSRAPLTLDKKMLEEIISQVSINSLPADGTVLATGIITAANRLKKSKAKSRSMIVLTDGMPTPNDSNPQLAIDLARKLGIKIYTIGIGSKEGGWREHPFYGWQQIPGQYNEQLLKQIAQQTGGRFFQARNPQDMAAIYRTIDELETTALEAPIYSRYYEYFWYFLCAAFILLLVELCASTLLWMSL